MVPYSHSTHYTEPALSQTVLLFLPKLGGLIWFSQRDLSAANCSIRTYEFPPALLPASHLNWVERLLLHRKRFEPLSEEINKPYPGEKGYITQPCTHSSVLNSALILEKQPVGAEEQVSSSAGQWAQADTI